MAAVIVADAAQTFAGRCITPRPVGVEAFAGAAGRTDSILAEGLGGACYGAFRALRAVFDTTPRAQVLPAHGSFGVLALAIV